jgi:hypothetical protein
VKQTEELLDLIDKDIIVIFDTDVDNDISTGRNLLDPNTPDWQKSIGKMI